MYIENVLMIVQCHQAAALLCRCTTISSVFGNILDTIISKWTSFAHRNYFFATKLEVQL